MTVITTETFEKGHHDVLWQHVQCRETNVNDVEKLGAVFRKEYFG
jgi:hypothetical protein